MRYPGSVSHAQRSMLPRESCTVRYAASGVMHSEVCCLGESCTVKYPHLIVRPTPYSSKRTTMHVLDGTINLSTCRRASMSQYFDNLIWDTFL